VLPTFRVQGQYRFDRAEIEGWARYKKIGGGLRPGRRADVQEETVSLLEAVRRGGIHYKIEGNDPERIFPALVDFLPFGPDYPAELKETLVAELRRREALAPTAIGHGIALPHPRHPRDWGFGGPVAGFFFLEAPVDFDAVDGQPVFLLVMLLCATIKGHLSMLSRVTHLLADPALREYLAGSPARSELMEKIAHAFPESSPAARG
ncbi:MAG: PTS sugar transporter subunit IIA, partial [bacterium]